MLLRYSLDMESEAKLIEDAVAEVIDGQGIVTSDLGKLGSERD